MANALLEDIRRLKKDCPGARRFLSEMLSLGFCAILVYRLFHFCARYRLPVALVRFPLEKLVEIFCGISLPAACRIGPGFRIHHFGGIVIHESVRAGSRLTIYHNVTIGLKHDTDSLGPVLGCNVRIGTGAAVLGPIRVGDNVTIGANAVVVEDVPDNTTVAGNPARVVKAAAPAMEV
jgi:serine O-acetyltransferase